jgi:hypothetical protein
LVVEWREKGGLPVLAASELWEMAAVRVGSMVLEQPEPVAPRQVRRVEWVRRDEVAPEEPAFARVL